ncbi:MULTISPECIES: PAAR domain-containing protein [unclassified Acinetobacter]|uniref:PAAR domain-containing protein n=1 Tax=unclassified Acinetobacter TaxID=196816 RepID=UPI0015D17E18|nr:MULTISPECIES: PAAR domain-containing protein [unclassified Acinetobacter]
MKALITVGCKTDHGGIIVLGDASFLVEGRAVHLDGMTHYCPKCKVQSRAIASNQGFMTVGGKSIVAVNDTSSCGSKYLKNSDLAVMTKGVGIAKSKTSELLVNDLIDKDKDKIINKIYWSYGKTFTPLEEKSRFFDDLNVHIEAIGYEEGENIDVEINPDSSNFDTFEKFTVSITINNEGKGLFKNVFQGKTIIIDTEY